MSESVDENIRIYSFPVPGYIPGIPGRWAGGSWAKVNEDTKQVLDWGPKPVEQATPNEPPAMPAQQTQMAG